MLNVGRVLNSSKLRQAKPFTVWRKSGSWVSGRFIETETSIPMSGVITPATAEDILQVPEGDRTSEIIAIHSTLPLFLTHNDVENKGTSDQIEWHGERYKLLHLKDWSDFGYYKALGTSMGGA